MSLVKVNLLTKPLGEVGEYVELLGVLVEHVTAALVVEAFLSGFDRLVKVQLLLLDNPGIVLVL